MGACALWFAARAPAAVPFPEGADWLPLLASAAPILDPRGDSAQAADPGRDLVGDASGSALAWWADDETFFLRARLAGEPASPATWAFLLTFDGNHDTWERQLSVEGPGGVLLPSANASGASGVGVPRSVLEPAGLGSTATGEVRVIADGPGRALELQVARQDLELLLGIPRSAPLRVVALASDGWDSGPLDVAGCDERLGPCPSLVALVSDAIRVDLDADGIPYPQELELGTDPDDADTDEDGLLDEADPDPLSCDTDRDGLPDGLELGVALRPSATDPAAGCFAPDADPGSTTDPRIADTDGDGVGDGAEDLDRDGRVGPWETDPATADRSDADLDGIPDRIDDLRGQGPDLDSDGDGLADASEGQADSDLDGTPDFADLDSDGDGWSDAEEGGLDADSDGLVDALDLDSDDDGVPDAEEGMGRTDPDSDDDGVGDAEELPGDPDADGLPDALDPDSDGDGAPDGEEGTGDTDGDGAPDLRDLDSDADGLPDRLEHDGDGDGAADDSDGDGLPDRTDPDSDGDGLPDQDEGTADSDCDGLPDRLDIDPEDSFCDDAPIPGVDTGEAPPEPVEVASDPFAEPGGFGGGGGCDASGAGSAVGLLPALLALLALSGRRRSPVLGALAPASASAQEVDADRFSPSVEGGPLVLTEVVGGAARLGASAWVDHADDPLVYRTSDGEEIPVLGEVTTTRLLAFVRGGPLRLGVELPVHAPAALGEGAAWTSGDLRLSSEARLARLGAASLGLLADTTLPTGDTSAWLGAGRARLLGAGALSVEVGPWSLAANAGLKTGSGRTLGALRVGPAVVGALGLAWQVADGLSLSAEAAGERWLGEEGASARPVEGILSARRSVGGVAAVHLGAGAGLTSGVGSPDLRLALGLSWWLDPPAPG